MVQSVGDSQATISAEIVGEEFLNVHHRGEVFSGEPPLTSAAVGVSLAEVAGVAARCVAARAVINE